MSEISIEVVTNYDPRITNLLESIRKQTFQGYEVIVVSSDSTVKELVSPFDLKFVIAENTGTLYRRILAHEFSSSKRALLLESSRFLVPDALEELIKTRNDLKIVEEKDVGNNYISKIQNIERKKDLLNTKNFDPDFLAAEPRYFNSEVLTSAFTKIRNIPAEILKKIQWGDMDIIYYETFKISQSVEVINKPLIFHFSDESITELIKKYYNYGVSSRELNFTIYRNNFKMRNHFRPFSGPVDTILVYSLWTIKAVSFAIGAYL